MGSGQIPEILYRIPEVENEESVQIQFVGKDFASAVTAVCSFCLPFSETFKIFFFCRMGLLLSFTSLIGRGINLNTLNNLMMLRDSFLLHDPLLISFRFMYRGLFLKRVNPIILIWTVLS